jgi:hypothetical protein
MNAVEQLTAARELIADPEHWTQGAFARDDHELACSSRDPNAQRWCAWGALVHIPTSLMPDIFLLRAAQDLYQASPQVVNDQLGHDQVLRMYDRAIKLAKANA